MKDRILTKELVIGENTHTKKLMQKSEAGCVNDEITVFTLR